MVQEVRVHWLVGGLVTVQDMTTVALGAGNALYFLRLLRDVSLSPARRLGAAALATVSLAVVAQGSYFLLLSLRSDGWEGLTLLGARTLTLAGAAFISALILRQRIGSHNKG